jgi:hypothetical protein
VHVHCGTGASPFSRVASAAVAEAVAEAEGEAGGEPGDPWRRASLVARMDPRTAIREGQAAKVHVDRQALHFFDPGSGRSIRG